MPLSWQEAARIAFTTAPTDAVVLDTLEFRHPSFVDDDGVPTAVRVVVNAVDITARLEADAPLNPGALVVFTAIALEIERPQIKEGEEPQLLVRIDNVGRVLTEHLERAVDYGSPVEATWRSYLSDALDDGPQNDPPMTVELDAAPVDDFFVGLVLKFDRFVRRRFPGRVYDLGRYPSLAGF